MKIKLFENFDEIDLEVSYEICETDRNGDEDIFNPENDNFKDDAFDNINPFDFKDVANYYMKCKKMYKNRKLSFKKVTKETIDDNTIELFLTKTKYNL